MNGIIKQRWVDALRSGNYAQGTGFLRQNGDGLPVDKWCCLGVLCDLAAQDGYGHWEGDSIVSVYVDGLEHKVETMPTDLVLEWAGVEQTMADALANMNDNGDSFDTIAEHIAEHIEEAP